MQQTLFLYSDDTLSIFLAPVARAGQNMFNYVPETCTSVSSL